MKKNQSKKKKSLADEFKEASQKAREELAKLPPDEQKKIIEGQRSLMRKWKNVPYY
ncbi:MAG: hypothetical protein K9H26_16390 [Prolixibacteraceae bacterium]|nr:hypothetical protein [Prolixibacteraceae bacterium]